MERRDHRLDVRKPLGRDRGEVGEHLVDALSGVDPNIAPISRIGLLRAQDRAFEPGAVFEHREVVAGADRAVLVREIDAPASNWRGFRPFGRRRGSAAGDAKRNCRSLDDTHAVTPPVFDRPDPSAAGAVADRSSSTRRDAASCMATAEGWLVTFSLGYELRGGEADGRLPSGAVLRVRRFSRRRRRAPQCALTSIAISPIPMSTSRRPTMCGIIGMSRDNIIICARRRKRSSGAKRSRNSSMRYARSRPSSSGLRG